MMGISAEKPEIMGLSVRRSNNPPDCTLHRLSVLDSSAVAGVIPGSAAEQRPQAQSTPYTPREVKRVAVIGSGHYHATAAPGYLKILQDLDLEIVGVHDFDPALAKSRADRVNGTPYFDYRDMCEKTKPDFVLSLCRHDKMSEPIRYLINAGVPFMAEKPWGTDPAVVNELAELAETKKAWATFPAPMRYSQWAQTCRDMVQNNELGPISHIIVRFNQPGVQRYIDEDSAWMLSKKEAGGGALINLGIHGFDLCAYITGEEPKVVAASTSHGLFNLGIEDYAFVTLRTPSGIVFINEAGYTYPANGSDSQRLLTAKNFVVGTPGNVGTLFGAGSGLGARGTAPATTSAMRSPGEQGRTPRGGGPGDSAQIVGVGRNQIVRAPAGYVGGWPGAVGDAVDRLRKGLPPAATPRQNARAVSLTFDSYRIAGEKA